MKKKIHPKYGKCIVRCICGNTWETRSTLEEIVTEVCSTCHGFWTGKQRIMDTLGRVEKFRNKYAKSNKK